MDLQSAITDHKIRSLLTKGKKEGRKEGTVAIGDDDVPVLKSLRSTPSWSTQSADSTRCRTYLSLGRQGHRAGSKREEVEGGEKGRRRRTTRRRRWRRRRR